MSIVEALEMETVKPLEGVPLVATEVIKPRPFEVVITYTGAVAVEYLDTLVTLVRAQVNYAQALCELVVAQDKLSRGGESVFMATNRLGKMFP